MPGIYSFLSMPLQAVPTSVRRQWLGLEISCDNVYGGPPDISTMKDFYRSLFIYTIVAMRAYRLEFLQPDGRWTGPYCAEYMTREAFDARDLMNKVHTSKTHKLSRSFPDFKIFADNPGKDRLVCASPSKSGLYDWFEGYIDVFLVHGGHIGEYELPKGEIIWHDDKQLVYRQRAAKLIRREGKQVDFSLLKERFHPTKFPKVETTKLREALEASWDSKTANQGAKKAGIPALGQCYPTSRVFQMYFPKAEIVEGTVWTGKSVEKHFWNIIDTDSGRIHMDFTWQQFPAGSKVQNYWIRDRETLGDGQNTVRRVLLLQSRVALYLKQRLWI